MTLTAFSTLYPWDLSQSIVVTTMALTATTHRAAAAFQAPTSGSLSQVGFRTGSVTTAADLRVRVETIASDGNPSGTLVAAGAEQTVASASVTANTWIDVTLGTAPTVSTGDLLYLVIDAPSGTPNLNISRTSGGVSYALPFTNLFTTLWARSESSRPVMAVMIGGSWRTVPQTFPVATISTTSFNSGSTPDERGNKFTMPVDAQVDGAWVALNTTGGGACDIVLYDSSSTVLASQSIPASFPTLNAPHLVMFDSAVSLAKNDVCRIVLKPTSVTNVALPHRTFPDATRAALMGGDFHRTTRVDGGAWTDTTTARENIGLMISQVHDTSGGATGRYKAKVGGVFVDIA